jgi:hypothetical protein
MIPPTDITCSEARGRWLRGVDEGSADRTALAHVEHCADCLVYVREMGVVLDGLADLKRATQSLTLDVDGAHRDKSARRRWFVTRRALWRVAAALALLVTGAYVGLTRREHVTEHPGPMVSQPAVAWPASPAVSIRLVGQSRGAYIAVADRGVAHDVDIIRLYPVSARNREPERYFDGHSTIRSKENHQ